MKTLSEPCRRRIRSRDASIDKSPCRDAIEFDVETATVPRHGVSPES
jgi:hypothetical protein